MLNIDELIKKSLKNKKSVDLKVYRNIKAEIMAFKTQKGTPVFDETAEINILKKYASKLEDSKNQYSQAGREDLVSECIDELEVLQKLLPEPVKESDIEAYLVHWYENGIEKKNMGSVIKEVKSQYPGADGKMVSEIVKKHLI